MRNLSDAGYPRNGERDSGGRNGRDGSGQHRTRSAFTEITLEAILSRENLTLALKRVEANKGAPGVDGMTTEELRKYIFEHPGELTSAILSGKYRPAPLKRVTIPKPEKGKFRNLGIPTVIDRLV